ncbi:MAG: hypothetical protein ACPHLK_07720 [Gammaproteobacteria bacterium]|jgi:putative protein kinase ArgK-like GTPase of G3E family
MVDSTKNPDGSLPARQQDKLINQIDELENLLAEKKVEAQQIQEKQQQEQQQESALPRMTVGTDGIPVLVEAVTEDDLFAHENSANNEKDKPHKNDEFINEIIDKIDKEITEDLDELILMLKDSIIDEVKTRLLQELKTNKDTSNEKK